MNKNGIRNSTRRRRRIPCQGILTISICINSWIALCRTMATQHRKFFLLKRQNILQPREREKAGCAGGLNIFPTTHRPLRAIFYSVRHEGESNENVRERRRLKRDGNEGYDSEESCNVCMYLCVPDVKRVPKESRFAMVRDKGKFSRFPRFIS